MVSFITYSSHFTNSHHSVVHLKDPIFWSQYLVINPKRRLQKWPRPGAVCFDLVKESYFLRLTEVERRSERGSWCCWCKSWESDGDAALEAEILEFMKKSEKPEAFPTKTELVNGGRMDLVEAIGKKGGWWSLGWEFDEENVEDKVRENEITAEHFDIQDFQQRPESISVEGDEVRCSSVSSDSYPSALSSDRSLERATEEDSGIEGILSRLEKQRNLSFGINLGQNGIDSCVRNDSGGNSLDLKVKTAADSSDSERSNILSSSSPEKDINIDFGAKLSQNRSLDDFDGLKNLLKPDMWRAWSSQRAGFSDTEFEAAEIAFDENRLGGGKDASTDKERAITEGATGPLDIGQEINHNQIRTRLQHLELELASALRSLRSKSEVLSANEGHETSSTELRKLSDAWEFQENEFMNAQNILRSIRAKLAILEGKMALAIIDAQKMVEEKHKRIDDTSRAMQLLRTTCIVWPNSGSEVLLTGSFDGWTTQRKMEKSSKGVFSVCLKLYPGRYEIKFIVDGIWRIDPLRPIVHNEGYENNLFIIT